MFTTSCFIRKNTPELRKRLSDLGYRQLRCSEDGCGFLTDHVVGHCNKFFREDNKSVIFIEVEETDKQE